MMLTPEQLADHKQAANCGKAFHPISVLAILRHIDAQQGRIAELEAKSAVLLERIDKTLKEAVSFMNERNAHRDRVAELEQFVAKVAQQTPEKPDHWSTCGQCERNASDAEDLIEAAKSRL